MSALLDQAACEDAQRREGLAKSDAAQIEADLAEDVNKASRRFAMQYRVAVEEQAQMWRDNGGM